jgi:hypothetical protein
MGHAGRARGTLEWVVPGLPYILVYEVNDADDLLVITAVFHGAQNRDRDEEKSWVAVGLSPRE